MRQRLRAALEWPDFVACSVQTAATADYHLHPDEDALLHPRAVPKRREDFRLGRAAAHAALAALRGSSPLPLLAGAHGEPSWPAGVVGAISHSGGVAIAAAADAERVAGLGLDLEAPDTHDRRHLAAKVCRPVEQQWIAGEPAQAEERFRLLFSAKESCYKALFPLGGETLDFHDVELTPEAGRSQLRACTRRTIGPYVAGTMFPVEYRVVDGYVVTYLTLPRHR